MEDLLAVVARKRSVIVHAVVQNLLLAEAARELETAAKTIDTEALEMLAAYDWPGNVRQLVNATRRLTVTAPGRAIATQDIPADLGGRESSQRAVLEWTRNLASWAERELGSTDAAPLLSAAQPVFEKTLIEIALKKTHGHRQEAAKLLGWGRNTLTRKMKTLNLE